MIAIYVRLSGIIALLSRLIMGAVGVLRSPSGALAHILEARLYALRSCVHLHLVCRVRPILRQLLHLTYTLRPTFNYLVVQHPPTPGLA